MTFIYYNFRLRCEQHKHNTEDIKNGPIESLC